MNLCYPLGIYATVHKHLNRPLEYPGDPVAWEQPISLSSAQANGYLSERIVPTENAKDESFNAADDDFAFSWRKFWPKLAERFDMPWTGPDTSDQATYQSITLPNRPPRGYGSPGALRFRFTPVEWAKKPEVRRAWQEITERYGLRRRSSGMWIVSLASQARPWQ
jgi:hypothetical protein